MTDAALPPSAYPALLHDAQVIETHAWADLHGLPGGFLELPLRCSRSLGMLLHLRHVGAPLHKGPLLLTSGAALSVSAELRALTETQLEFNEPRSAPLGTLTRALAGSRAEYDPDLLEIRVGGLVASLADCRPGGSGLRIFTHQPDLGADTFSAGLVQQYLHSAEHHERIGMALQDVQAQMNSVPPDTLRFYWKDEGARLGETLLDHQDLPHLADLLLSAFIPPRGSRGLADLDVRAARMILHSAAASSNCSAYVNRLAAQSVTRTGGHP